MRAEQRYRPPALVLAHRADQRDRDCHLLGDQGYNVLGFDNPEDAAAWLQEETPVVAFVARAADHHQEKIIEILKEKDVTLVSIV